MGYELKIDFLLNKNKDDTNRISDIIKNDKKIIVSHGPVTLQNNLDTDSILFFKTSRAIDEDLKLLKGGNVFFSAAAPAKTKTIQIKNAIENFENLNRVLFLYSGKNTNNRVKFYLKDLKTYHPENFNSFNLEQYLENDKIDKKINDILKETNPEIL